MMMGMPAAGLHIHFHISRTSRLPFELKDCAAKIRPAFIAPEPRVQNLHSPAIEHDKFFPQQTLMKPNKLKKLFRRWKVMLAQKRRAAYSLAPLGIEIGLGQKHLRIFFRVASAKVKLAN